MKSSLRSSNKRSSRKQRRPERTQSRSDRWAEQPVTEMSAAVACPVCGHPVDPRRTEAHMLRFHGGHVSLKVS